MAGALYTELTTGVLAAQIAPFIASGDDGAINSLLTSPSFTKPSWVSVAAFNAWCAQFNAEYLAIVSAANDNTSPLYSAANSLLRCLNGAVSDGAFNLADSSIIALLNSWVFADKSGASKAALIAAGNHPASRADIIGLDCSIEAIANSLRG
jgi:hypothetical protein